MLIDCIQSEKEKAAIWKKEIRSIKERK